MALFAKGKREDNNGNGDRSNSNENADSENLGFVPPLPPPTNRNVGMSAGQVASSVSEFVTSGKAGQSLKAFNMLRQGDIEGAAREFGLSTAADLAKEFKDMGFDIGINVDKPMGDGDVPKGPAMYGNQNHSYYNATRLTMDPAPTEVRLNTGIKPDTFTPDYQITESGYASPLHISCINLGIPSPSSTNLAGNYWNDSIMFDLRNRIQRNITFSLPSNVNATNLTTAINALIYALSIYYSISRLLVYGNNPMNKNESLLYLRGTLTSSVGDDFLRLKRLLEGMPIPPNLNTLVYYMYQIYLSSELPGSPALMFMPHSLTNGVPTWTEIASAISGLTTSTNQDMYAVIGRAVPQWYGTKLFTGSSNPLHDPNFTTIFTNAPFWYTNTVASVNTLGPSVTSYDVTIRYNSWTNNLDGGAFALTSMWNSSTSSWIPSLLSPFRVTTLGGTDNTSRVSWFTNGTTSGFYSSSAIDELVYGRDETYTTSYRLGNTANTSLMFGSERCWGITGRVVVNTVYQLMDWMLSWDSVPIRVDKNLTGTGPLKNGPDMNLGKPRPPKPSGDKRKRNRNKGKKEKE